MAQSQEWEVIVSGPLLLSSTVRGRRSLH